MLTLLFIGHGVNLYTAEAQASALFVDVYDTGEVEPETSPLAGILPEGKSRDNFDENPDAPIYDPLTPEQQERRDKYFAELHGRHSTEASAAAARSHQRRARTLSGNVSNLKF